MLVGVGKTSTHLITTTIRSEVLPEKAKKPTGETHNKEELGFPYIERWKTEFFFYKFFIWNERKGMLNSLELGILIIRCDNENVHVTGLWGIKVLDGFHRSKC